MEKDHLDLEERFEQVMNDKMKLAQDYVAQVDYNNDNEAFLQELQTEFQTLEKFVLVEVLKMKLTDLA
jgi:UDP-N-acetylmuramyl tripeptide synthase